MPRSDHATPASLLRTAYRAQEAPVRSSLSSASPTAHFIVGVLRRATPQIEPKGMYSGLRAADLIPALERFAT